MSQDLFDWVNSLPRFAPETNVVRLKRGNAIPVLVISPTGDQYVYNSIRAFATDTVGISKRSTIQRRVAQGGGRVGGWYGGGRNDSWYVESIDAKLLGVDFE